MDSVILADNEKWIAGYEGLYSVTTEGNVYSWNYKGTGKKRKLRGIVDKDGYLMVDLSKDGKHKKQFIHRLVAQTFIPNPEYKPQVNHKSGVKTENYAQNLEWATGSENLRHAVRTGLHNGNGTDRPVLRISPETKEVKWFSSATKAEQETGINQSNISAVCRGKRNHAGGWQWK